MSSLKFVLSAAAAVAILAGCGPSQPPATTQTTPAAESAATAPAPEAAAPAAVADAAAQEAPAGAVTLAVNGPDGQPLMGDPARGERVFAVCRSCHSVEPGSNGIGPSLHGIMGRVAGTVEGFNYSAANRNSGITWTDEQLFAYLERPSAVVPGTTMAFAGLRQPQQRADLIAYLHQLSE
jgi:cytochrome c